MRRKIIKQGNRSLTLTLPISWIREQSIAEGNEVEIAHSGDYLIIGAKESRKKRSISIEVKNCTSAVKKLLACLYRTGYDEINIHFESPKTGSHIHEIVLKQMVGYEIIKMHDTHYLIKDIANLDPENFEVLFKKSFLLLLNFQKEVLHQFKERNLSALQATISNDLEINKLTNLCQRLLNKKMNDRRKIAILASLLKSIEYIGDDLKELVEFCIKKKLFPSAKALDMLEDITGKLQEAYLLHYNFNLEKALNLSNELRERKASFMEELNNEEIGYFLHSIIGKINALLDGPLILKINPEEKIRKEDWIT